MKSVVTAAMPKQLANIEGMIRIELSRAKKFRSSEYLEYYFDFRRHIKQNPPK